jgi:hypothetical protein
MLSQFQIRLHFTPDKKGRFALEQISGNNLMTKTVRKAACLKFVCSLPLLFRTHQRPLGYFPSFNYRAHFTPEKIPRIALEQIGGDKTTKSLDKAACPTFGPLCRYY